MAHTATHKTYKAVCKAPCWKMQSELVLHQIVTRWKHFWILKFFAEDIKAQGNYPKTIVFCQRYNDCGILILHSKKEIGPLYHISPKLSHQTKIPCIWGHQLKKWRKKYPHLFVHRMGNWELYLLLLLLAWVSAAQMYESSIIGDL